MAGGRGFPSGLKAGLFTTYVWAVNGWPRGWLVATSHNWIVPSKLPEARVFPSGLKATLQVILIAEAFALSVGLSRDAAAYSQNARTARKTAPPSTHRTLPAKGIRFD